jgi:hypothetical protein
METTTNSYEGKHSHVPFQVVMTVAMKISVFWAIIQCRLADIYQRF